MGSKACSFLARALLVVLVSAPLGQWAAARQFVAVSTVGSSSSRQPVARVQPVIHHRAPRRFLDLRQRTQEPVAVTPRSSRGVDLLVAAARAPDEAAAFLPPPEHPPA